MPTVERTFTDMLRCSGDVLRDTEHQDVVLRRRDGADVMLVDLEREQGLRRSLSDAAAIIASLANAPEQVLGLMVEVLPTAIPWTGFLPTEERLAFMHEFATTASASLAAEVFEPLAQVEREWRATAAVYADPELAAVLMRPADEDLGPVERPNV